MVVTTKVASQQDKIVWMFYVVPFRIFIKCVVRITLFMPPQRVSTHYLRLTRHLWSRLSRHSCLNVMNEHKSGIHLLNLTCILYPFIQFIHHHTNKAVQKLLKNKKPHSFIFWITTQYHTQRGYTRYLVHCCCVWECTLPVSKTQLVAVFKLGLVCNT